MSVLEKVSQSTHKHRANWLSASSCPSLKQTSKQNVVKTFLLDPDPDFLLVIESRPITVNWRLLIKLDPGVGARPSFLRDFAVPV